MVLGIALNCGNSKRADDGARSRSGGTSGDATGGTAQGGDGGMSGSTPGGSAGDVTGGVGDSGGSAGEGAVGGDSGDAGEAGSSGAAAGDTSLGGAGGAAGSGGLGGAGAGAAGGGSGGVAGADCPIPSVLFPPVVPTDQTIGLEGGQPNPPDAPAKSFDSYNLQSPCNDTTCDDCSAAGWRYEGRVRACSNGLRAVQNFTVGGVPGMSYRVTLHFYGVVEPRNYGPNITRESGTVRPENLDAGASPPPWAYATGNPTIPESDYGTWELHVVDHEGNDVCSYYLNSDTEEGHWTYMLSFERTINVIGGGRIRIRRVDADCRIIKNCFAGGSQGACSPSGCNNKARTIDVSAAMPPPTALSQPGLVNDTAQSGQWVLIDVVNVACGLPALGCDGR
jgi:hypothetical protein